MYSNGTLFHILKLQINISQKIGSQFFWTYQMSYDGRVWFFLVLSKFKENLHFWFIASGLFLVRDKIKE